MPRTKAELAQRSKALTHPLRVKIMGAFEPGRVTSPSELAEELGEPLHQVGYHVLRLAEWGCIEFVEDRKVAGALEHFYRVAERPYYDQETWEGLTATERAVIARGIMTDILADIAGADGAGVLDARLESHFSRTPLELDARSWVDLDDVLMTLVDAAHDIAAQSASRVASGATAYPEVSSARLLLIAVPTPARRSTSPPGNKAQRLRVEEAGSFRKPGDRSTLAERYKALSHPLRARILSVLGCGRVASPPELAQELGEPIDSVRYHVQQLAAWRCLDLVDKRKRRGAIEHFYTVAQYGYYDSEAWEALTAERRADATRATLTAILADIVGADAAGVLDTRLEMHFTRSPLELDDRGWADLDALMVEAIDGARELSARTSARAAGGEISPTDAWPARLMMLLIPAPPRPTKKPIS